MIPMADPLGVGVGIVLLVTALASVVLDVMMIVVVLRRRESSMLAFWIGAGTFFVCAAYLSTFKGMVDSCFLIFFFAPALFGFLLMIVAVMRRDRAQSARRTMLMAVVGTLAFALLITISIHVRTVHRQSALMEAVMHDSTEDAVALLRAGVAHGRSDAPLREELLLRAARDGNPRVVAALLEAGADPNGTQKDRLLNAAALSADLMYKPATEEDALRTVQTLLDHGADPNAAADNQKTAVLVACQEGRWTIERLLRSKGAKQPCGVPDHFDDLMIAARSGDVARVKELAVGPLLTFQQDSESHSPLKAAIESRNIDTVNALLERYGSVSDDVIDGAMPTAIDATNVDAVRRLLSLRRAIACRSMAYAEVDHNPGIIRALTEAGCKPAN